MYGDTSRSPETWYKSLPPLTRFILTVTFLVTLTATFGLFNPRYIILDWTLVYRKFQVWRLFTDYFFSGAFGINWLMHIYFLVSFSSKLEVNEMFTASPGAYLYFLVFQCLFIDVLSLVLFWPTGKPVMAKALSFATVYYWSRKEPYSPVGLWGFQIQAYQFPFALLFLDLVMGNSIWSGAMGLTSGHIYYFLKDVLPQENGMDFLKKSPKICDELMTRAAYFDIQNPIGSLKVLIYGLPSSGRTGRAPTSVPRTASSADAGGTTRQESPTPPRRSLFTGSGHRLGGD